MTENDILDQIDQTTLTDRISALRVGHARIRKPWPTSRAQIVRLKRHRPARRDCVTGHATLPPSPRPACNPGGRLRELRDIIDLARRGPKVHAVRLRWRTTSVWMRAASSEAGDINRIRTTATSTLVRSGVVRLRSSLLQPSSARCRAPPPPALVRAPPLLRSASRGRGCSPPCPA